MVLATAGELTDLDPPRGRCVSGRPANRPGVYREGRGPPRQRRTPRTIPRTRAPAKTVHSGTVTCGMSNRTLTPRVFSAANTTATAPTTTVVTRRAVSNGRSPHRCRERSGRRGGGGSGGGAGCGGGGPYIIAPTPSDDRCVQRASHWYPVGWWKHTAVSHSMMRLRGSIRPLPEGTASSTPDRHGWPREGISSCRMRCRNETHATRCLVSALGSFPAERDLVRLGDCVRLDGS
jgi:hypothetical protein